MDFIYARQSVEKEDSISIESQIELCLRESTSSEYQTFKDRGYSGKNTERPDFQEMMSHIRNGETERVIVYRLDRISRSVLDFAELINEFQKYGVEFISVTERFDTSTPIGKAMLMIVMVFAQLERETIQQRVTDAYRSRSKKGFYMGCAIPYGMRLKETIIDGIKTKMYEGIPEQIEVVKLIYSLYSEPQTSLYDVMRYLKNHNIKDGEGSYISAPRIRYIVSNPVYLRCDDKAYNYFNQQGVVIINDVSQFTGINGAYLYTGDKKSGDKISTIDGNILVLAPHEGFIDSDTWIKCKIKCSNVKQVAKPVKAKNTWLAGKIKCRHCGYAMQVRKSKRKSRDDARYFVCIRKYTSADCVGTRCIPAEEVEDIVFLEMKDKLKDFSVLQSHEKPKSTVELTKLHVRLTEIEKEINTLVEKIALANKATMNYINQKIEVLDLESNSIKKKITDISSELYSKKDINTISDYLSKWDNISISDKITVVDALIDTIYLDEEHIDIIWKI